MALEVGASVLLPPVHERLELLLSILPEDPSSIVGLTAGQVRPAREGPNGARSRSGMYVSWVWLKGIELCPAREKPSGMELHPAQPTGLYFG